MRRWMWIACLVGSAALAARAEEPEQAPKPAAVLEAHVRALCAPSMRGRRDRAQRELAAAYIAQAFEAAGLLPLPGQTGYALDGGQEGGEGTSEWLRNVAGYLPAAKPPEEGIGQYLILSAHYDHLGEVVNLTQGEQGISAEVRRFDGADDNASGVAVLLELARRFGGTAATKAWAAQGATRALVFVAFDLEEQKVLGSQAWVRAEPLPLQDCAVFVTMDMLGRSVADLVDGSFFAMGTEHSPELFAQVEAAGAPSGGRLLQLGIDFQPGYSDYLPFQHKKVPFVFVTSGACGDYHSPGDTADRLDYTHLAARATWLETLTRALGALKERPSWCEEVAPSVGEIQALKGAIEAVAQRLPELKGLPPVAAIMVKNFVGYLNTVLEDGEVTAAERSSARNTTLQLFQMAASLGRTR